MKYRVEIGLQAFEIEDGNTALSFAELATARAVPSKYNGEKPEVTITIVEDEEE